MVDALLIVESRYSALRTPGVYSLLSHLSTQNGVHEAVILAKEIRRSHTEPYQASRELAECYSLSL